MGMMDQAAKAKFILALHKHSLQAFDSGGMVGAAPIAAPAAAAASQTSGGLAGALTAQNGYNAQLAPVQNTDYGGVIQQASQNALTGYGQAQNIQGQQQNLANDLVAQSHGMGPNPAQAALNQETGQNVAAQAALMAGQRGAAANPGLVARQIAQQGAATQQQAVGQSATLQAQQQIAAQQALAAQQQAMASGNLTEQGVNANLFSNAAGAQNSQNAGNVTNYGMVQGINSGVAQNNANAVNKTQGGLLGGIGGALSSLFAEGGMVKRYSDGGEVVESGPKSHVGRLLKHGKFSPQLAATGGKVSAQSPAQKATKGGNSYANDKVPALLSEDEIVIPRSITKHPMAPQKAAQFVQAVLNKRKMGKGA